MATTYDGLQASTHDAAPRRGLVARGASRMGRCLDALFMAFVDFMIRTSRRG